MGGAFSFLGTNQRLSDPLGFSQGSILLYLQTSEVPVPSVTHSRLKHLCSHQYPPAAAWRAVPNKFPLTGRYLQGFKTRSRSSSRQHICGELFSQHCKVEVSAHTAGFVVGELEATATVVVQLSWDVMSMRLGITRLYICPVQPPESTPDFQP